MLKKSKVKQENSIIVNGIKIYYGIGGLHACIESGIYETTATKQLIDVDVAGYYMNIVAKHGRKEIIYPEHLGSSFIDVVDDIIAERAKYPKGSSINNGMKLAGNGGIFGASKDRFTPIYDILYFLKIVVTGQLLIFKLIEDISLGISNITFIQVNTDGITVLIDKDKIEEFYNICKRWELYSLMTLEYVNYNKMWVRDVNNYIAISDKGKIKYKGAYEIDKELHKNHSMKIVHIAVSEYFLHNIPIQDTIRNHTNILDFCKRFKGTANWIVEYHYIKDFKEEIKYLSKNVRYFISTTGGALYKRKLTEISKIQEEELDMIYKQGMIFTDDEDMKIKKQFIGVDTGYNITIFNERYDIPMKDYKINYNYYIKEANKLITDIHTGQIKLL